MNAEHHNPHGQFRVDTHKNKQTSVQVAGQDYRLDVTAKTKQTQPSDKQHRPDRLSDQQVSEDRKALLLVGHNLVSEYVLSNPESQQNLADLKRVFPLTYQHSHRVAAIAASIAIDAQLPLDVQKKIVLAAAHHDVGKADETHVPWDSFQWTEDERERFDPAIKRHPHNSADRAGAIDASIVLPILLHHSFQEHLPVHQLNQDSYYPSLKDYWEVLTEEDFLAARIVSVADQVEAIKTRTRINGAEQADEEVIDALRAYEYKDADGVPHRAFTEREITTALAVYHLLDEASTQKAA